MPGGAAAWPPLSLLAFSLALALVTTPSSHASVVRGVRTIAVAGESEALTVGGGFQYARAPDETEISSETAIEYGLNDRFGLALEPVFWEYHDPRDDPEYSGTGDTELTLTCNIVNGESRWPVTLLGGKIKIPTADDPNIGTGETDYSALLIAGKEIDDLELSLELEYTFVGSPASEGPPVFASRAGVQRLTEEEDLPFEIPDFEEQEEGRLINFFSYELAADFGLTDHISLFAALSGETAPAEGESASATGELEIEYDLELTNHIDLYLAVGYDTDNTTTAHIGLDCAW